MGMAATGDSLPVTSSSSVHVMAVFSRPLSIPAMTPEMFFVEGPEAGWSVKHVRSVRGLFAWLLAARARCPCGRKYGKGASSSAAPRLAAQVHENGLYHSVLVELPGDYTGPVSVVLRADDLQSTEGDPVMPVMPLHFSRGADAFVELTALRMTLTPSMTGNRSP